MSKRKLNNLNIHKIKELKLSDIKAMSANLKHIHLTWYQWVFIALGFIIVAGGIVWICLPKPKEVELPVVAI